MGSVVSANYPLALAFPAKPLALQDGTASTNSTPSSTPARSSSAKTEKLSKIANGVPSKANSPVKITLLKAQDVPVEPTGKPPAHHRGANSKSRKASASNGVDKVAPRKRSATPIDNAILRLPGLIQELAEASFSIANEDAARALSFIRDQCEYSANESLRWADELAKDGFVTTTQAIWPSIFAEGKDLLLQDDISTNALRSYNSLIDTLWNGSDKSDEFCNSICETNLIENMLQVLSRPYFETLELKPRTGSDDDQVNKLNDQMKLHTLNAFTGTLHNCFRHCTQLTKQAFRDANGIDVIKRFIGKDVNPLQRAKAFFILAYAINENENDLITSGSELFDFVVQELLKPASESDDHYATVHTGTQMQVAAFSAEETMEALNALAVNDANKLHIVGAGALPLYERLLTEFKDEKELLKAVEGIWILSFHGENQKKLSKMDELKSKLEKLAEYPQERIQKAARGTLWNLSDRRSAKADKAKNKAADAAKNTAAGAGPVAEQQGPHVMLSYQWNYKPIALKVNELLKATGFSTWIDVDKMTGSTLDAMAAAVEQAAVILMFISEEYKNSPSCRMEAEYAMRLRKEIVPVLTQYRYRPDGWLGILIGTKLYFDCSTVEKVDTVISSITKELGNRARALLPPLPPINDVKEKVKQVQAVFQPPKATANDAHSGSASGTEPTKKPSNKASTWTPAEVCDWLRKLKLDAYVNKFAKFDGALLRELFVMYDRAPQAYYTTVRNDLGVGDCADLLAFTNQLQRLFKD